MNSALIEEIDLVTIPETESGDVELLISHHLWIGETDRHVEDEGVTPLRSGELCFNTNLWKI